MLEKEKFPQDYFPEVGAGPGRQAAAERPEQALRPWGMASPWLFPGTGALAAPHMGCAPARAAMGWRADCELGCFVPGVPRGPLAGVSQRRPQGTAGERLSGEPGARCRGRAAPPASGCGGRGAGRRVPGSWRSEDVAFPWLSLSASLRIGHVIWTPGRVSNVRTSTRGVSGPFVIHVGPQGWPPRPVLSAEPQPHGRGVFPPLPRGWRSWSPGRPPPAVMCRAACLPCRSRARPQEGLLPGPFCSADARLGSEPVLGKVTTLLAGFMTRAGAKELWPREGWAPPSRRGAASHPLSPTEDPMSGGRPPVRLPLALLWSLEGAMPGKLWKLQLPPRTSAAVSERWWSSG